MSVLNKAKLESNGLPQCSTNLQLLHLPCKLICIISCYSNLNPRILTIEYLLMNSKSVSDLLWYIYRVIILNRPPLGTRKQSLLQQSLKGGLHLIFTQT